jgi:hypothetical protein
VYKIRKTKGVKPLKRKTDRIELDKVTRYNIVVYHMHGDINREIVKSYKANRTIANKVIKGAKRRAKKGSSTFISSL